MKHMETPPVRIWTQLTLAAVLMSGCAGPVDQAEVKPIPTSEDQVVGLMLFDWTGSFGTKQEAMRVGADAFEQSARPGDIWTFRYIGPRSYADDCLLFTIPIPTVSTQQSSNPFDRKARELQVQEEAEWRGAVTQAAQALRSIQARILEQTDIYGALAKAGEALATAPKSRTKVLVVFSDLGETVFREGTIDLKGVRVVFALTNDKADVKRVQKQRADWKHRLEAAGAVVTFYDPAMGSLGEVATGRKVN